MNRHTLGKLPPSEMRWHNAPAIPAFHFTWDDPATRARTAMRYIISAPAPSQGNLDNPVKAPLHLLGWMSNEIAAGNGLQSFDPADEVRGFAIFAISSCIESCSGQESRV